MHTYVVCDRSPVVLHQTEVLETGDGGHDRVMWQRMTSGDHGRDARVALYVLCYSPQFGSVGLLVLPEAAADSPVL